MSRLPPGLIPPDAALLFRAPNWVGDAVLSLPALGTLRRWRPGTHITVATRRAALSVFDGHPDVASRIVLPSRREQDREAVNALRRAGFDAAVLLSPSFRSAYQVWRARVPVRIGVAREMRRPLLTHALGARGTRPLAHQVREYLDVAEALGAPALRDPVPRLEPVEEHRAIAARVLGDLPREARETIWIAPFTAGGATKRWPTPHVQRLIGLLLEQGLHPVITGGPGDGRAARRMAEPTQLGKGRGAVSVLAGRTTVPLMALAALARQVPVLVAVDTGPMHVWAAGGGRVVAIFGSSLPGLHSPLGEGHRVLHRGDLPCAGCYDRCCPIGLDCLVGISAEEVLTAVQDLVHDGR